MRKKATFTLALSAAAFAASVYALAAAAAYQPDQNTATPAAVSSSQIESSSKISEEESFSPKIIKEYNGNVAVFEENQAAPIKILDTQTNNLPPETAERLKKGITAFTRDEYLSYLEDFS